MRQASAYAGQCGKTVRNIRPQSSARLDIVKFLHPIRPDRIRPRMLGRQHFCLGA